MVTVNVAVVEPAGMITLATAGLATEVVLDESATVRLPGAAGHSSVTVAHCRRAPSGNR